MAHPFGGGRSVLRGGRGSHKRLRRITPWGNASFEVWALLVFALLVLLVWIPWLLTHPPPPHQEHVFGEPEGPGRAR